MKDYLVRGNIEENAIFKFKRLDNGKEEEVGVTLSVGVTNWDVTNESFDIAEKRSDKAMYAAKDAGRNRVEYI